MGAITFGGLVSGLDTASLVEKLVSIERDSTKALSTKQSDLNTQKSIVASLNTAVAAFATAIKGLDLASEGRPLTATSSDSKIGVAVSSSATAGLHDLRVKSLAASKVVQSKAFSSRDTAGIVGNGGVNITVNGTTKSVSWGSTDTLDGIASKINSADAGVTASVVDVSGTGSFRIVVTAKDSGTAAAPTFSDTGGAANRLDFAVAGNVKVAAADAVVNVDGIDITRSKNVITDALTGVTLTLNAIHDTADPSNRTTVATDQKSLTEKVKAVVTAYNSINSALHVQLDYTGTKKGTNTLFGDSTLRQLQQQLGTIMSNSYGSTGSTTLSAIGITRDRTGAMTLDESKLAAAVASDSNAVNSLFIDNGFAAAVTTMTDSYTLSGTGVFAAKTQSLTDRSSVLQTQIDRINRSADDLQERLEKQFNALEQAMSSLTSQSSQLLAMLR